MADKPRHRLIRFKRVIKRMVQVLAAGFVSLHVYALSLIIVPVPGTLNMGLRAMQGADISRDWTALETMSPHLVRAVIAAEDSGFCDHDGVSFAAIRAAIEERQKSGRVRGASTLTQQTAKNVFFWNGGGYIRKAGEAWFALFIDQFWGKKRVLEVYLNVAEWGDGVFGAEAAAQARFGKSAADLSRYEASLLAAVLPNPHRYRLDPPTRFVAGQARTYQARMRTVERQGLDDCI